MHAYVYSSLNTCGLTAESYPSRRAINFCSPLACTAVSSGSGVSRFRYATGSRSTSEKILYPRRPVRLCMASYICLCLVLVVFSARGQSEGTSGRPPVQPMQSASNITRSVLQHQEKRSLKQSHLDKLFSRIAEELSPWKDGITLEAVERAYCTDFEKSFRFQIINSSMYVIGEMTGFLEFNRVTKLFFLAVARNYKLPDVDIVFSTADGCPQPSHPFEGDTSKCPQQAPLFAFDKRSNEDPHCVLFPDFTWGSGGWPLARLPSWGDARDIMKLQSNPPLAWEERIPKLFFRGAHTGNRLDLASDENFTGSTDIDFRLTGWTGLTPVEEYVAIPEHCKYRYLLNLPGNGWSVRLKYLMLCGSPVIFPKNHWEEYWYHVLEDKNHLVMTPAVTQATRGSDLLKAVNWLKAEPSKAEQIGEAGRDFVEEVLTEDTAQRYFAELLMGYARLQTFTPVLHPDAVPFSVSVMGPDGLYDINKRTCSHCAITPSRVGGSARPSRRRRTETRSSSRKEHVARKV